ncbi:Ankyrin repeat protein [Pleurostoma richardsiae]|uniref:Ankyrin repeat protein n=1 Tax=Pleurostoma richardsiae TaxID=41990 RepID=A0AA38VGS3_9PEZI|nr:Ankyrin repeat protein [Pleurostoma richardsiae]
MSLAVTTTTALIPAFSPSPSQLGIVVARYQEPLDPWEPFAANTYLYSKGDVPQSNDTVPHSSFRAYVELRNEGREGQTHLHHIVGHYDRLEDIMIFSQADPFDLLAPVVNTTDQMVQVALEVGHDPHGEVVTPFNPDLWHDIADWDKIDWNSSTESIWITPSQIASLTPAPYTPGEFWTIVLRGCHPPAIRAMHGGTFALRRETIRSRPREVYERALAEFEKADAVNPEVGYFMERMWAPVFSRRYWLDRIKNP